MYEKEEGEKDFFIYEQFQVALFGWLDKRRVQREERKKKDECAEGQHSVWEKEVNWKASGAISSVEGASSWGGKIVKTDMRKSDKTRATSFLPNYNHYYHPREH